MEFTIRPARREDCPAMLELIRELAVFERSPNEVTVSPEHFEQSGFGEKPVWWAYVACATGLENAEAEEAVSNTESTVNDPLFASVLQESQQIASTSETIEVQSVMDEMPGESFIQLNEAVEPTIPEPIAEALPLMQPVQRCEKVIGFALYYIRYSTWKGQRMYLEDLLVTESWRNKGVGTALMDALIGAAKAEDLHGISWQVLKWNESAIRFYERYSARLDGEWLNAAIDV
jgi:ribosomal protein S18 acetylase RimI-like enzyme